MIKNSSWASGSLHKQLTRIERDIIRVLTENKRPMSQEELYKHRRLKTVSEYGWTFALERLEKGGKVKFVENDQWQLTRLLRRRKRVPQSAAVNDKGQPK